MVFGPHTHNEGHFAYRNFGVPYYRGDLQLVNWRTDGFMSLETESEGSFTTVPFTFDGVRLELNTWTRFGGEIKVEVADATEERQCFDESPNATAATGRSLAQCDRITGDNLAHMVTWGGESDVSHLAGKRVRLRFYIRRGRLYSLKFA